MKTRRLRSAIKHLFIPHEANDYRPHFFRELTIAVLLVSSVFFLGVSAGSSFFLQKTILGASITASVLVDLANETRLAYNEPLLTRNTLLDNAAQLKGEDMSTRGYFSHNSPDGITPWYWLDKVGYVFMYAGENLAVNFFESKEVQSAWLNSPTHKDNLLNSNFKEIGIATVEGIYKNTPTIFVVQMFGSPASAKVATKIKTATTTTQQEEKTSITSSVVAADTVSEVKGDSNTKIAMSTTAVKKEVVVQKIIETPELIIVKNTDEELENSQVTSKELVPIYAPWYGKYIFGTGNYIDTLYKIVISTVFIALLVMILVEIKKQHYKHISYGILLLIALTFLLYINKAFII